jgi:hypothetical protein
MDRNRRHGGALETREVVGSSERWSQSPVKYLSVENMEGFGTELWTLKREEGGARK